jgi:carbon-monoxide dehydrogenase catalytic subunit
MVARGFLRAVAAGSACYLHIAESTARRLGSIGEGATPVELRSPESMERLAKLLGENGAKRDKEQASACASAVLADLYLPRQEKMKLVKKLATAKRYEVWERLGILPGGAKSEVFDAIVKTSTNLSADPANMLVQCLSLGIATGIYGLELTNLMNDAIMGAPEIRVAPAGFRTVDPAYINIAVTGHSHSVFAGLIKHLEAQETQFKAQKYGAKGVRIVGLTCVGQDMQLRAAASDACAFAGQAGNNFTQEALLATGAVDLLVSEFNCTLPGIGPIAQDQMVRMICLDDVCKQAGAELKPDLLGKELELAAFIVDAACDQYSKRRPYVKIDLPKNHGRDDVLTGVAETSLLKFLGGSLEPLIDLIGNGTIKGVAGILGCSNLAAGGHDVSTVALTKELIKRDVLVLSAGCTSGGLANCGLCSPDAAQYAGPGLRAVCEKLGIPPVLNFGPCLAIGRIQMVAAALAEAMGVDIPDLPVVVSAPQWLEEQALADGCFALALGLPLHLCQPPPILGSPLATKLLTQDLEGLTGGKVIVEPDVVKAADQFLAIMQSKIAKLEAAAK